MAIVSGDASSQRAKPDVSLAILEEGDDVIVSESVAGRVALPGPVRSLVSSNPVSSGAEPEGTLPVLYHRGFALGAEVCPDFPVESTHAPVARPKPEVTFAILMNFYDVAGCQPIGDFIRSP